MLGINTRIRRNATFRNQLGHGSAVQGPRSSSSANASASLENSSRLFFTDKPHNVRWRFSCYRVEGNSLRHRYTMLTSQMPVRHCNQNAAVFMPQPIRNDLEVATCLYRVRAKEMSHCVMPEPRKAKTLTRTHHLQSCGSDIEDQLIVRNWLLPISNGANKPAQRTEQWNRSRFIIFRAELAARNKYSSKIDIDIAPPHLTPFPSTHSRVAQEFDKIRRFTSRAMPVAQFVQ